MSQQQQYDLRPYQQHHPYIPQQQFRQIPTVEQYDPLEEEDVDDDEDSNNEDEFTSEDKMLAEWVKVKR